MTAAKSDGRGGFVCPSGKTLSLVAAQEAVRLLDEAVADLQSRAVALESRAAAAEQAVGQLQGRLNVLDSRTAITVRETPVPWAVAPDGTVQPASFEVSCGSGKAISGSVRTTNAVVSQSYVTGAGSRWKFEVRATGSEQQAHAYVTCMGPSGSGSGPAPVPGGS